MNSKDQLRRAKMDVVQEYRDFDILLMELGRSFADGFNNILHQVKASYLDLDLSHISIDLQAQMPAQPIYSESTNELFNDDTIADPQGEEGSSPVAHKKLVDDQKAKDVED